MKLTSEGAARLGRHESRGFPVSDFDFKPDDFDGCFLNGKDHIALTVEEAEKLMKLLDLCEYWLTNNNVSYDCDAWASLLEGRIKQAEKGDGKA